MDEGLEPKDREIITAGSLIKIKYEDGSEDTMYITDTAKECEEIEIKKEDLLKVKGVEDVIHGINFNNQN